MCAYVHCLKMSDGHLSVQYIPNTLGRLLTKAKYLARTTVSNSQTQSRTVTTPPHKALFCGTQKGFGAVPCSR